MENEEDGFTSKNPTAARLISYNIILEARIDEARKEIKENKKQIKFLLENRLNEGI